MVVSAGSRKQSSKKTQKKNKYMNGQIRGVFVSCVFTVSCIAKGHTVIFAILKTSLEKRGEGVTPQFKLLVKYKMT